MYFSALGPSNTPLAWSMTSPVTPQVRMAWAAPLASTSPIMP